MYWRQKILQQQDSMQRSIKAGIWNCNGDPDRLEKRSLSKGAAASGSRRAIRFMSFLGGRVFRPVRTGVS